MQTQTPTQPTNAITDVRMISHVSRLCGTRSLTKDQFVAHMMLAGVKPITSRRIYDGDTNIRVTTAAVVATLLGVGIGEIIEVVRPKAKK